MNVQSLALEVARINGNQEQIDQRLASIDNRLSSIDQRFMGMDLRIANFEGSVDRRFGRLNTMLLAGWVSIMLALFGLFVHQ